MTERNSTASAPPKVNAAWRLDWAPVHVRLFVTVFFCAVGLGSLAAQAHLYFRHRHADGDPALSVADIVADLHGRTGQRPIVRALNGKMRQYVESEAEAKALLDWAAREGPEREYHLQIADILSERCTKCHAPRGKAERVPLTSYSEVMKVVKPKWLSPAPEHIARVTHIHLLALSSLWMLTGCVTLLCGAPSWQRSLLAAAPLFGILMDAVGQWLAPLAKSFVGLSLAGGAVMGIGFLAQFLLIIHSLWLPAQRRDKT